MKKKSFHCRFLVSLTVLLCTFRVQYMSEVHFCPFLFHNTPSFEMSYLLLNYPEVQDKGRVDKSYVVLSV